jgi:tRNA threonylcarbamoyl adenosine modification protein YeaZ
MKVLAIEFSSAQRSAAVVDIGSPAKVRAGAEVVETGHRGTEAFGLIEAALQASQLEREQVECIVVGVGPGSYTGIRAAIALAQGWQLARDIKLLGVSSAECVAARAQMEGLSGRIAVIIDAQRGEFYLANYEVNESGWREMQPLRITSADDVRAQQRAGFVLIGPEAAERFEGGRTIFPGAEFLGLMATGRIDFIPGE